MDHLNRPSSLKDMPEHPDRTPDVSLDPSDANELVELLTFLSDWLNSHDSELLTASLNRYVGNEAYDITTLQADLTRFAFLIGDNGERLFGPKQ
jgi:hypothetical protein